LFVLIASLWRLDQWSMNAGLRFALQTSNAVWKKVKLTLGDTDVWTKTCVQTPAPPPSCVLAEKHCSCRSFPLAPPFSPRVWMLALAGNAAPTAPAHSPDPVLSLCTGGAWTGMRTSMPRPQDPRCATRPDRRTPAHPIPRHCGPCPPWLLPVKHETLGCTIHLKWMKHLEHTLATYMWNICNIQITTCNMKTLIAT
jgi:hypothetical protein